jgi:hypothetical protein
MNILSTPPTTWQELQKYVADILAHCDYDVTVEKDVETARGKVNLDVYAFRAIGYNNRIICECKNWDNNIPQHVIHSFRTVVNDFGASHGFIIAKKGFQSGAYEAVKHSNISILTWDEFVETFTDDWLKCVVERNAKAGRALQSFGTYVISNGARILPEMYVERQELFLTYRSRYQDLIFFSFEDHYKTLLGNRTSRDEVDKRIVQYADEIPMRIDSYKDYFDYIYSALMAAIAGVEEIFDNKIKWTDIVNNEQGY